MSIANQIYEADYDPTPPQTTVEKLRIAILNHGDWISQIEVEERTGLSQPHISKILAGKSGPKLAAKTLEKIAEAYGLRIVVEKIKKAV